MNKVFKLNAGFTLIELLLVMGIGSVIGVMLITFLVQQNGIFYQQSSKLNQGVSLNNAMLEINNVIHQASAIVPSLTDGNTTYTSGKQTLVMSLPSVNQNGDVIDKTFDYLVLTVDSKNSGIIRLLTFPSVSSTRPAGNKVLVSNASLLEVSYLDKNNLDISPSIAVKVGVVLNVKDNLGLNNNQTSSSSARINLRNY